MAHRKPKQNHWAQLRTMTDGLTIVDGKLNRKCMIGFFSQASPAVLGQHRQNPRPGIATRHWVALEISQEMASKSRFEV